MVVKEVGGSSLNEEYVNILREIRDKLIDININVNDCSKQLKCEDIVFLKHYLNCANAALLRVEKHYGVSR